VQAGSTHLSSLAEQMLRCLGFKLQAPQQAQCQTSGQGCLQAHYAESACLVPSRHACRHMLLNFTCLGQFRLACRQTLLYPACLVLSCCRSYQQGLLLQHLLSYTTERGEAGCTACTDRTGGRSLQLNDNPASRHAPYLVTAQVVCS
jgi:hypothetical protein